MTTSADQGPIAEIGSPVLITPAPVDGAGGWRWQTGAIAVATALLLLFNANTIQGWFDELTPGPATEPLRAPVTALADATARAGLDGPRARLHALWERVRAARFGSEEPGERGAAAGEE